jgi:long-chain acyl-CoA synthetase
VWSRRSQRYFRTLPARTGTESPPIVDDKTFSFRELDAMSNRVASGLVAIGINPDSNPQATAETIRPDGWLHTGDIATMDEDGYATIVDRKKDMIITAGFKVFPAEIERVLCMHPAFALAAVGSVPDEAKGELAKAYVILEAGAEVSGADLVSHCREHPAAYKVPRALQFVARVPTTSSGKIMRRMLNEVDDGSIAVS